VIDEELGKDRDRADRVTTLESLLRAGH